MIDACDPDANIDNLRQLIRLNTGVDIKLTKKEICEAYDQIQEGKLPLPPLVMNSSRTYLVDKKSPLKPTDYELLFDAATKRVDLKRIARKVNLKNVEQMTKTQIVDAIGKRLRYMKIHEPVKIARRTQVSVTKNTVVNGYNTNINTVVNNFNKVNNTAVNNFNKVNNTAVNGYNTNINSAMNNFNKVNNTAVNTNLNRVNNTAVNTNLNRVNTNLNRTNTSINRPKNKPSKVTFPMGGLFAKGEKPKFLGGVRSAVKPARSNVNIQPKKKGFFAGLFGGGKKEEKNFIAANKFGGSKPGYVFRKGENGLGYYLNAGVVQGPQIPLATNIIQPTPVAPKNEDLSVDLAVVRIKQLSLKREKKFIDEISNGISKKKDVVQRAEQAKKEEDDLVGFLEQLELSNTNRAAFIQRMTTNDFNSLKVEAQLKSDEKRNVVRTNEEKMAMFLETTTLDAANRQTFLNKSKQEGANIDTLISEARKLQEVRRSVKLQQKQAQFKELLSEYALSNDDKMALIQQVTETANVNSMKRLASELVAKRKDEKKNIIQQNLLTFLQPLEIPQSNKNMILQKSRVTNANINTLKREALNIEKKRKQEDITNDKKRLMNRLEQIGLGQINQNSIVKKFNSGNRNVDKLIEEAKELQQRRNQEGLNTKRKEYSAFLNTLQNLTPEDREQLLNSGNFNQNKARNLSKERAAQAKAMQTENFSTFLNQLGLTGQDKTNMIGLFNGNTLTMNALKRKATELRNKRVGEKRLANRDVLKKNLENATNLENAVKVGIMKRFEDGEANLTTLRTEITQLIQNTKNARLANKKQKLAKNVQNSSLSQANKNAFIRKLDDTNLNLNALRGDFITMIEKAVETQRAKDRDELEEYMISKKMSNTNRGAILSKFNANSKISLIALKQEANALLEQRFVAKRMENAANLNAYGRKLGLNNATITTLTNKLNREDLNSLKAEANRIAEKKASNLKEAENKELNKYMTNIGLNANNKRNVLNQKLPLNNAKRFANDLLQKKIAEKRNKNKAALSVILNKLNITNTDRNQFFNNLNKGVDVRMIKQNAIKFSGEKKKMVKGYQRQDLIAHLSQLKLNNGEQRSFLNAFNRNADDLNSIKKQASEFAEKKIDQQKKEVRNELLAYLNSLKLEKTNINSIMKNFNDTTTNVGVLKARAKEIANSRDHERWVESNGEFRNYLETLENLTNQDRVNITSNINSSFVNWNALKKKATNLAVKRASNRRKGQREELNKLMTNYGFSNNSKKVILDKFDDQVANLTTLKNEVQSLKKQMNQQKALKNKQEFVNFLSKLNLNKSDKNGLLEKYSNGTSTLNNLKKEATNLVNTRRKTKRDELFFYISELGLEEKDRNLIMNNFNNKPSDFNSLKNKAQQLKKAANAAELAKIRKELSEYLQSLNMLTNENRKALINTPGASTQNIRNKANNLQQQRVIAKKTAEATKLANAAKNLPEENRKYVIDKFNTQNVTLESMLNEVADLKKKIVNAKRASERVDLYQYINNINLPVQERKLIMSQFDQTNTNLATMKGKANSLKREYEEKKIAANRSELEKYMKNSLKLSQTNINSILNKFNAGQSTLLSLKANAEELLAQRKDEKRLANRNELLAYFKEIGLSEENGKSVLNKFNSTNIPLNGARKEAATLLQKLITQKRAQNRVALEQFMNTLQNLNNVGKKAILKEYDSETANLNTLKNKASQINAATKNKAEQRRELYRYINSLGINATPFMNKFDSGKGTLNSLKANANKTKAELNARAIDKKKDDLRAFMNNTRISNANKNSFLNRVNLNTNLNTIKKEVRMLNATIENKEQKIAGKKTELRVFLNTLNNVTPQNKQKLIAKVVNNSTNINQLKNEGRVLNKAVKNKRAEAQRLKEEEEARKIAEAKLKDEARLESHLKGLKDLTANRVEYYKGELAGEKATLAALMAQSKDEDKKQKSEKTLFYNYIRNTKMQQNRKKNYIAMVKAPRSDIVAIKKLVNANIEAIRRREVIFAEEQEANQKKREEEAKKKLEQNLQVLSSELQKLTNLTDEDRTMYMNSLKARPTTFDMVIKQAQNKNGGVKRRKAMAEEERKRLEEISKQKAEEARKDRNKTTKNLAESLQSLSTLTRENRKKFMNRLQQNNPRIILSNAMNLNKERKAKAKAEEERRQAEEAAKKKAEEERRQAEEAAKKKAEEERKVRNAQTKKVATNLQGLKYLKRDNRIKFMNKLPQNGANKVLANAKKLDQNRKEDEASTRRGIEWKLKKIGVTGSDLQGFMKRWDVSKDKGIFDEARKIIAKKRDPLLARIKRNVPASNNFSQAQVKWSAAIREATDDASLQKIERLLDTKLKLKARTEAEVKSLPPREQTRYLKNFMAYKNDVAQRTQELDKFVKTKRNAKDAATRETATKLKSFNKLERQNRQSFMNRVTKGENSEMVLRNAEKLQRNRSAAARLEAQRKEREERERQQVREREEKERKQREYEKQKQTKLRANTAKMLQGMSGLERSNRKEFMNRLNRGNDPARVISNASARNQKARSRPKTVPQQPQGRVAGKTKKMKAKNRARIPNTRPSYGSRTKKKSLYNKQLQSVIARL